MFQTDLLSYHQESLFTAIDICHTGYIDCLLVRSGPR
jgi:hypothetical protein